MLKIYNNILIITIIYYLKCNKKEFLYNNINNDFNYVTENIKKRIMKYFFTILMENLKTFFIRKLKYLTNR